MRVCVFLCACVKSGYVTMAIAGRTRIYQLWSELVLKEHVLGFCLLRRALQNA